MAAFDVSKLSVPPLPTLTNLNATVPDRLNVEQVAFEWLTGLAATVESRNVDNLAGLFIEDSWWRDMLALTWDFRTFRGTSSITIFLRDCIDSAHPRTFRLCQEFLELQHPDDDVAWITALFDFETKVGVCSGIFRLVPTATGEWKAHTVYTNLDDLKAFREKIGVLRDPVLNHSPSDRNQLQEYWKKSSNPDPLVVVIGAGHSGLNLAARLKCLEIPALVVERNERIGDNWRNRYDALCLHDPVWYDHMSYLPFPSTWPLYTPARKLANWLESYADILDLNVWTSSIVTRASQDPCSKKWDVTIKRGDGPDRVLSVNHVIFATGLSGPEPNIPRIPGMDRFTGQILHSTQHKRALDHAGKKVVVIGACSSAHDIAHDYYNHGVDVTMYQRSPTYVMSAKNGWDVLMKGIYSEDVPPTEIADRIDASFPHFGNIGLSQYYTRRIAELDKELLNALQERGFKTNFGIHDTGILLLEEDRAGGYYIDTGASKLIADGKIKIKGDGGVKELTEMGLVFEDGSELPADVIVFATGLGDTKGHIRKICGDKVALKCSKIWGFNREGEINGVWRNLGVPGLWYMAGNMALSRFHSKHLALQIKAIEENVYGPRYGIPSPLPN